MRREEGKYCCGIAFHRCIVDQDLYRNSYDYKLSVGTCLDGSGLGGGCTRKISSRLAGLHRIYVYFKDTTVQQIMSIATQCCFKEFTTHFLSWQPYLECFKAHVLHLTLLTMNRSSLFTTPWLIIAQIPAPTSSSFSYTYAPSMCL